MRALGILPDRDQHGNDWSGAFKPEATLWARHHGGLVGGAELVQVPLWAKLESRRASLLGELGKYAPSLFYVVAFFTHGLRHSLPQMAWTTENVDALASHLARVLVPGGHVVLYACSSGTGDAGAPGGEGGFADALRDAMLRAGWSGGRVFAHEKAGHTTCNPFVRAFDGQPGVLGGDWLVDPAGEAWHTWCARLHDEAHEPRSASLRFRFPLMSRAELLAELKGPRVAP